MLKTTTTALTTVLRRVGRSITALISDLAHGGRAAKDDGSDSSVKTTSAQIDDVTDAVLDDDNIDATGL